MPIAALVTCTSTLAAAALCTSKSENLELAFAGDARGVFLCLQCFISEDEEFCRTKDYPACVVNAVLSTESHIRFSMAASPVSTAMDAKTLCVAGSSDRAVPSIPHILLALQAAIAADPFLDGDAWRYILSRATSLSKGIQALIEECVGLESLVSCTQSAPIAHDTGSSMTPADVAVEEYTQGCQEIYALSSSMDAATRPLAAATVRKKR